MEQLSWMGWKGWTTVGTRPRPAETSGLSHGWPLPLQSLCPRYSHYVGPRVASLTAFALAMSLPMMQNGRSALFQAQTVPGSATSQSPGF